MFDTDELKEFYVLNEAKKWKMKSEMENYNSQLKLSKKKQNFSRMYGIEKKKIQHRGDQ